jgi:hypothetical protein
MQATNRIRNILATLSAGSSVALIGAAMWLVNRRRPPSRGPRSGAGDRRGYRQYQVVPRSTACRRSR